MARASIVGSVVTLGIAVGCGPPDPPPVRVAYVEGPPR